MLPWGTFESRVPKEPFQKPNLRDSDNAGTKADKWPAGGALHGVCGHM